MYVSFLSGKRVAAFTSAVFMASMLAACGGGSNAVTPSMPYAPQSISGDEQLLDSMTVAPDAAAAVESTVTAQTAHAFARQGAPLAAVANVPRVAMAYAKDLTNYGGPTMKTAKQYNLYVNCAASCWGTPSTFESHLNNSTMIHITDQYVGSTANGRYPYAGSVAISYKISGTLADKDVYNIVHQAAAKYGTGYGKIYHVFFAKGVNECSQSAGGCYSPSNPNNWTYCAYHGSVNFSDIGHTIYSVEPYQAVNGCEPNQMPNGAVVDATASTLSHETFEAITDTDVAANNLAWYNNTYGEIGDECAPAAGVATGTVSLYGKTYGIQKEYSNYSHACKYSK